MLPEVLPLLEFKKDYNFFWYVAPRVGLDTLKADLSLVNLLNVAVTGYVSQLTEKVDLPTDEIEIEIKNVGNLEYKVPKRVKMNDITVTYLDDSLGTVYQWHKNWMMSIRDGSLAMKPIMELCAQGTYVTVENTLSSIEYMGLFKALENAGGKISETVLEAYTKPTSLTLYPNIYPIKISRPSANKASTDISRVTVTYTRLPNLTKNNQPLMLLK